MRMSARVSLLTTILTLGSIGCSIPGEFSGVAFVAEVPAEQHALYESLLPYPLEVPDQPLISVNALEVTASLYRETQILVAAEYDGTVGWFPLAMPINNPVGQAAGVPLGFPKYVTSICHRRRFAGAWDYRIDAFGLWCRSPNLRIRWSPDDSAAPMGGSFIQAATELPAYSISPAGCLLRQDLTFTEIGYAGEWVGYGELSNDFDTRWAPLLPDNEYPMTRFLAYGVLGLGVEQLECGL